MGWLTMTIGHLGRSREGIVLCFSITTCNHDLCVMDILPSVCTSLTKAMVHCICT